MFIRRPKTTAERRQNQSRNGNLEIDGYRIKVRARRNSNNLVDSWDDLIFAAWRHRSWKRHRKSQWKSKYH